MLAARGEGLLSWIEDDSFIVDEIVTAIPEGVGVLLNGMFGSVTGTCASVNLGKEVIWVHN
ncbi:hypothetical protein IC575_016662 [Cucumis melo]